MAHASEKEVMAALFANMIVQQAQTAYMFLGKTPNPENGQVVQDLDTAKYFIDQLEMLAIKTRGNLDRQEEALLKQSLTTLRLAFVEATGGTAATRPNFSQVSDATPGRPEERPAKTPAQAAPAQPSAPPPAPAVSTLTSSSAPPEESRKKFSKRY